MRKQPSLLKRLAGSLVVVQFVMVLITLEGIIFMDLAAGLVSGGSDLDKHAERHVRQLVANSIVQATDGSALIAPTAALERYGARTPTFKYAALDPATRRLLPGSSADLVRSLGHIDHIQIDVTKFAIVGDHGAHHMGNMRKLETPAGEFVIVTYGYAFDVADIDMMWSMMTPFASMRVFTTLWPLILMTLAIALFVARSSLKPLQRAVASAKGIDLTSLDQRLPTDDVPVEVLPLVNAVNDALARVDLGVTQQRRFIANAAHELRTPVAILNARIDSPRKPTFEIDVKRDARRIRNIVEQLLVASRLGELPEEAEQEVDLIEIAERQVVDHMVVAIKSGRQIDFRAPQTQVIVKGNRRALESVVANLIDNALHAEPENGTIVVRLTREATLEVVDHGPGVSEAERELIFEPFWRKSDAGPGTGLGLAIVKEIVELHKGRISIETTPGGGATFKVSLPPA
ncbi:HAMP domain-containing sensor histidine kinase [Methylocystis sp.]|uniref:sensor histidine kinase n=1 Tax=Methylocystis sp. TaxID=1911079 RepID=UPI0025D29B23|nr:HAMP domain-containing sensor histidine kinase [Methylocystis sp.]